MSRGISEAAVEAYRRDGYLTPLRVMTEAQAAEARARVEAIERAHPDDAGEILRSKPHLVYPWLYDLIFDTAIVAPVGNILGPNVLCWSSGFFTKQARDPSYVSWHQDSTYWGLEPTDIVTAWIAFSPSRSENGCMRVVPGSHESGQIAHVDSFAADNLLSRGQEIEMAVDEREARDVTLAPGEMSLHHVRLVHGSEPNRSDMPRIGFVIRYIPTYVRQLGTRTTACLVAGRDDYGHFDPELRPKAERHPEAMAFRAQALGAVGKVLYEGAKERAT